MIQYFFIVLLVFAVADYIGFKTKSLISGPFVSLLTFLILFQLKLIPTDIIERAGMTELAVLSIYLMMVDMGTMMDLRTLRQEWRTVLMGAMALAFSAIGIFCASPIIGREEAMVAVPVIHSGLQGTIVILGAATEKGFAAAYALGVICYAVKKFAGTIVGSVAGRKAARAMIRVYRDSLDAGVDLSILPEKENTRPAFCDRFSKYYTNATILAIMALLGYTADLMQDLTGINYTIYCLLLGFAARNLGFLPEKALTRSKAAGLLHTACFANLIPALATIVLADLVKLLLPMVVVFAAALLSISFFVLVLPGWKVVGSKSLAMGVCMGQMLAFPATMMVSGEIINSFAKTPGEAAYLEKKLMVPYVLGGLVSATIISIIVAEVCGKLL